MENGTVVAAESNGLTFLDPNVEPIILANHLTVQGVKPITNTSRHLIGALAIMVAIVGARIMTHTAFTTSTRRTAGIQDRRPSSVLCVCIQYIDEGKR